MEPSKGLNRLYSIFNQYNKGVITEDELTQRIQEVATELDLSNVETLKHIEQKISLIESGEVKDRLIGIVTKHFPVDHLTRMPDEIKIAILSRLDPSDLASVVRVNQMLFNISQDPTFVTSIRDPYNKRLENAFATEYKTMDKEAFKEKYKEELKHANSLDLSLKPAPTHESSSIPRLIPDSASLPSPAPAHPNSELIQFISDHCPNVIHLKLPWKTNNDGLAQISKLTNLKSLDLSGCKPITGAGLAHLKKLTQLERLNLSHCRGFGDASLEHLSELTQLERLNLLGCDRITDAGLAHLKKLTQLERLDLAICFQIGDAGLKDLSELTNLKSLDLSGCYLITNAGLVHLKKLTQLERLNLRGCHQITDAGYKDLIQTILENRPADES